MYYGALPGVVMFYSVIFISDFFTAPISRRYCGFALAPAYDFNATRINCDGVNLPPILVEYV